MRFLLSFFPHTVTRKRLPGSCCLLLAFFLALCTHTHAESGGSVRGFVTDSTNGEPLIFANITVRGISRGTSTDIKGFFYIAGVPEGVGKGELKVAVAEDAEKSGITA